MMKKFYPYCEQLLVSVILRKSTLSLRKSVKGKFDITNMMHVKNWNLFYFNS